MISYIEEIRAYCPVNEQEAADQQALLWYADRFGDGILSRENPIAHITSSSLIFNATLDKTLLIHHNIRDTWAWTGGHADGDGDLLGVALREAQEETGVRHIRPLSDAIASIDILSVYSHMRRGVCVNAHLHLNTAYLLLCDEHETLHVKPDENSGVQWFPVEAIATPAFAPRDAALYRKLIERTQKTAGM